MSESLPFALTYVEGHTESAARELHTLPAEDTAAFLEIIPHKIGVRLIEKLPPQYAIQCILKLSPEKSTLYLRESATLTGVGLLRLLPASFRRSALKALPERKSGSLKKQLNYPANVVGAWMDLDSPQVPLHYTVGQVRQMLRALKGEIDHSLYVVNEDGQFAGLVKLSRLARSRAKHTVRKIMIPEIVPLPDRELLTEASRLGDWDRFDAYPVVDADNDLVGLLTRKNLQRGLRSITGEGSGMENRSLAMEGFQAYTMAVQEVVKALVGLLPGRGKRKGTGEP